MSIYEAGLYLDPQYDHLVQFRDKAYKSLWTPAKYLKGIKNRDAPHILNELAKVDRQSIERCILAVLLVEDKVKQYWPSIFRDFPQTIVGDVGSLFGTMETTHRVSYHGLAESLGLDVETCKNDPAIVGRIKYLAKHQEEDPKIIGHKRKLKRLVLFSALVERCSLFTQFYILMSYAHANKGLETLSALQGSTALEEIMHFEFGVELVNIIKTQKPDIWTDYLVDLVSKNIEEAYKAEIKLIDWFFEAGVPDHLEKSEVVNFLRFNFQIVCDSFDLPISFEYDKQLYVEKNHWFTQKTENPNSVDFFHTPVGGYSSDDQEEDLDDIFG